MKDIMAKESSTADQGVPSFIYNPVDARPLDPQILSLTVIGPDITRVDSYATAAFAMGRDGISFIAGLDGYEGYMIDHDHSATFTPGFARYVYHA